MEPLYIIQNQHQHYLSKQGEWVDGHDSQILFRTAYKDEAINIKVEHAVRSPELRLSIVPVTTNDKGRIELRRAEQQDLAANAENLNSPSVDSSAHDSFTDTAPAESPDAQTAQ